MRNDQRQQLFSEHVLMDHKNKIIRAKMDGQTENIIEVLLSLRVNALQINPELRTNLLSELIKNDILLISKNHSNSFLIDLLNIESNGLKHASCAFISIVASTQHGVDYLTQYGLHVSKKVAEIIKTKLDDCTDGSVTQRFCLAIL